MGFPINISANCCSILFQAVTVIIARFYPFLKTMELKVADGSLMINIPSKQTFAWICLKWLCVYK